jgi:hypothetical protein
MSPITRRCRGCPTISVSYQQSGEQSGEQSGQESGQESGQQSGCSRDTRASSEENLAQGAEPVDRQRIGVIPHANPDLSWVL